MWAANWYTGQQQTVQGSVLVTELRIELMEIDVEIVEPLEIEIEQPLEVALNEEIKVDICG